MPAITYTCPNYRTYTVLSRKVRKDPCIRSASRLAPVAELIRNACLARHDEIVYGTLTIGTYVLPKSDLNDQFLIRKIISDGYIRFENQTFNRPYSFSCFDSCLSTLPVPWNFLRSNLLPRILAIMINLLRDKKTLLQKPQFQGWFQTTSVWTL